MIEKYMTIIYSIFDMKMKNIIKLYSVLGILSYIISFMIFWLANANNSNIELHTILSGFSLALFFLGTLFFIPVIIGMIMISFRKNKNNNTIKTEPKEFGIITRDPKLIKRKQKLITSEEIRDISKRIREVISELKENKSLEKPKISESIKPEIPVVIENPKEELKTEVLKEYKLIDTEILSENTQKLTYKTIIPMVLKGKGKIRAEDALSECKKLKDLKEWDKIFPLAKSRFKFPVITTTVNESGTKVKYVEWKL